MKTLKQLKECKVIKVKRTMKVGLEDNKTILNNLINDIEKNNKIIHEIKNADDINLMTEVYYYSPDTIEDITWHCITDSLSNEELITSFLKRNPYAEVISIERVFDKVVEYNCGATSENRYTITAKIKSLLHCHSIMKTKNIKEGVGELEFKSKGYIFRDLENDKTIHGDSLKKDNLILDCNSNIIRLNIRDYNNNIIGHYDFM